MHVKEIEAGDGERRIRYILARNPLEAERQKRMRDKALEEIRAELREKPSARRVCELVAHQTYGRYLKLDENGTVRIAFFPRLIPPPPPVRSRPGGKGRGRRVSEKA